MTSTPEADSIKRVTECLSKLGASLELTRSWSLPGLAYSTRASASFGRLRFQTYGKGRTWEESEASAAGEFIERLQNDYLLEVPFAVSDLIQRERRAIKGDYVTNNPDEECFDPTSALEHNSRLYDEVRGLHPFCDFGHRIRSLLECFPAHVPFDEMGSSRAPQFLPIDLIRLLSSSNGMAAGETVEAALLQALFEVAERYCHIQLFRNQHPILSQVDRSLCDKNQRRGMDRIEKQFDCKIDVLDAFDGLGLPVAGVLISKHGKNVSINLAGGGTLEACVWRSITEAFQFAQDLEGRQSATARSSPGSTKNPQSQIARRYIDAIKGYPPTHETWPRWANYNHPPSRRWSGFQSALNLNDLRSLFAAKGKRIFIRDVSFLGFPTVHVYVPGMSEINGHFGLLNAFQTARWFREWPSLYTASKSGECFDWRIASELQRFVRLERYDDLAISALMPGNSIEENSERFNPCISCVNDCQTSTCAFPKMNEIQRTLRGYKLKHFRRSKNGET